MNWVAPDATAVDAPAANQLGADLPTADPVGETPVDAAIRQMRQTAAHPSNGRPVVPMHVLAGAAAAALFVVALAAWLAVVFRASDASDRLPTEDEVARRLVASGAISVSAVDDAPALGATGGAFAVVASARGASEAGVLAVPVAPVPSDLVIVPAALPQVPAGAGAEKVADSPPAIVRRAIHAPVGFTTTNLRERPSTAARSLALLGNGATVDVLDGTANADGFIWLQTRTANGVVGWVVSTAVGA